MQPLEITFSEHKAKYEQLIEAYRRAIKSAELLPGTQLPSARYLADFYGVNRHTVMMAMQSLASEGWLNAQLRKAYVVSDDLPIESSAAYGRQESKAPFSFQFSTSNYEFNEVDLSQYQYIFAGGLPDLSAFPKQAFKQSMNMAARQFNAQDMHYANSAGVDALKLQIMRYLSQARALDLDDLLICNGSQEALYLVAKAFINKGDCVAIETLGYPPARMAFESCGADLVDIKQDEQGICVIDLEAQLKSRKIKLLYLTPLHQYPTTVTLPVSRRLQIYQLCYQYGVVIIEDDYDHEFHYQCRPLQPMAADDPAGIVIYISTFSKIMCAGARIGYLHAAPIVMQRLKALKKLINHKNDVFMQLAVAHWMLSGEFERHLKRMTKLYKQRWQAMSDQLIELQRQGVPISFTKPDGGMAIWLHCDFDVQTLKSSAQKKGVYFQSEDEFYHLNSLRSLRPSTEAMRHIRLGFAAQTPEQAKLGIQKIFSDYSA
ncbi:PLP-dependent aminotransferase family protein [Pseudoalteromonas phenolica]|uniref:PLP-dependent aminotransferase family protein n=1 Tax=Pseudoalteromonas phenolica TaxID=161398 RepID=A0A4Q7IT68_9GAMM|nr:PLP-dependent aminotransferase family protein [Pseudoalteromonas phenolica]RZQ55065.1 PLP-dependent aminotransferase family protein [Pseudoalteromonas phenolica]